MSQKKKAPATLMNYVWHALPVVENGKLTQYGQTRWPGLPINEEEWPEIPWNDEAG